LAASAWIIASVMFRGCPEIARHEECEAKSGARLTASASQNVLSAECETSTITPSRFSSRTTSLPNSVSPSCLGLSFEESAQVVLIEWVSER